MGLVHLPTFGWFLWFSCRYINIPFPWMRHGLGSHVPSSKNKEWLWETISRNLKEATMKVRAFRPFNAKLFSSLKDGMGGAARGGPLYLVVNEIFDPSKPYIYQFYRLSCNRILTGSKSTCNKLGGFLHLFTLGVMLRLWWLGGVRVAIMAKLLAGWTGGGTLKNCLEFWKLVFIGV